MHFVVLGCGQLGTALTLALAQDGHSVAAVDRKPEALAGLGPAFSGQRLVGEAFSRELLVRAGIERAAGLAALTGDDLTNALAGHVARAAFGVPRVVARLVDARQAATYARLDIETLAPDKWGAQRARELLSLAGQPATTLLGSGEVSVIELTVPEHVAGQAAGDLVAPGEIALVALIRRGHAVVPTAGLLLEAGDTLVLSVAASARDRLDDLFGA